MRMLFRSVRVKNIRSYSSAVVEFPEGSVLLSGDIGSGKTTLLLAIEFALFGILRGETSGPALLRHGCSRGEVELSFEAGGREFTILRSLVRKGDTVVQDKGFLVHDGVKSELTASELKARVFSLLGYPLSMVGKSKLLYRYTVYTPQEEMKRVLYDSAEERLAMIRKLFDVDKYERMRQNASSYCRVLRERSRLYEGEVFDFDEKSAHLSQTRQDAKELQAKIEELKGKVSGAKEGVELAKKEVDDAFKGIEALRNERDSLAQEDSRRRQLEQELKRVCEQLESLPLPQELPEPEEGLEEEHSRVVASFEAVQDDASRFREQVAESRAKLGIHAEKKEKVSSLDECPTCLQKVSPEHKQRICDEADSSLQHFSRMMAEHTSLLEDAELKSRELKRQMEQLASRLKQNEVVRARRDAALKAEELHKKMVSQRNQLQEELSRLAPISDRLVVAQKALADAELVLSGKREKLELCQQNERDSLLSLRSFEERLSFLAQQEQNLVKQLEEKKRLKESVAKLKRISSWLEQSAIPLISEIERSVLAKLHAEFEERFREWFGVLLDSDLYVRVDDGFSPVIVQNGYEVPVGFLSGGEQTACALAYRLALNAVVNDVVSIKTSDVIVLDEPTDGFSEEQVVRMRDVLRQVPCSQVVLVSHDAVLESFVETNIRVQKSGSESAVKLL